MCGIAGLVQRVDADVARARLASMSERLAHRGPDAEGTYVEGVAVDGWRAGLAHRRLAIIDLATGRQPMSDATSRFTLSFNGEIYNYRELRGQLRSLGCTFKTTSDTEVVLQAYATWGEACVDRLRGMFAFAIWDRATQSMFLARDRFGEKPLFYAITRAGLAFASEAKALLALPDVDASVSRESVLRYLQYRYVPGPATLYAGIRKLNPGSVARWSNGTWVERRYYATPDSAPALRPIDTHEDPVRGFRERLDESVARTMISDVPIGAFLSGGIDSSSIVALMARHSKSPVQTFSVGFRENGFNELGFASIVARSLGTQHHELVIDHRQVMDLLSLASRYRDAPVSEPADVPIYLLSCAARRSVTVVLSGEGSDEILGGYPKHAAEHALGRLTGVSNALASMVVGRLADRLPYGARRAKTALRTLSIRNFESRMARWFGAFEPDQVARLTGDHPPPLDAQSSYPLASSALSGLRRVLHFDQTSWLPDNLLERGDRMTMAASLELRLPFLDHVLAEYASSIAERWRVRGTTGKQILRKAMQGIVPDVVLHRPKSGFRMPVHLWFRGEMRDFLYDHLQGPQTRIAQWLDLGEVSRLLKEHVDGRENHEKPLWTLLNLELWAREQQPVCATADAVIA